MRASILPVHQLLFLALLVLVTSGGACATARHGTGDRSVEKGTGGDPLELTEAEWRSRLTPDQYRVLREGQTEHAFSGDYWKLKDRGIYRCAGCGQPLYHSGQKFDSGDGWPSFTRPVVRGVIDTHVKNAFGRIRIDLRCSRCGGHVGFAYDDGPAPTGMRHSLNSAALVFQPEAAYLRSDDVVRTDGRASSP